MVCKRICTEYATFSVDSDHRDIINLLEVSCAEFPNGPAQDYQIGGSGKFQAVRREQSQVVRDMFTALAICNNVTPVGEVADLESPNQPR
jgi:hypothetical protein